MNPPEQGLFFNSESPMPSVASGIELALDKHLLGDFFCAPGSGCTKILCGSSEIHGLVGQFSKFLVLEPLTHLRTKNGV